MKHFIDIFKVKMEDSIILREKGYRYIEVIDMNLKSTLAAAAGGSVVGAGMGSKKGWDLGVKMGFVAGVAVGVLASTIMVYGKKKLEEHQDEYETYEGYEFYDLEEEN